MRSGVSIHRQRGQVLIILFLGSVLFGGSAAGLSWLYGGNNFQQLRKQLKQVVQEPARRKTLGGILEDLQSSARAFSESHERQVGKLLDILKDHDTTKAEVDRQLADMDSLNRFSRQAMLDQRYALRQHLSAQEWEGLFPSPGSAPAPQAPTP
jgi:hypothetical protein